MQMCNLIIFVLDVIFSPFVCCVFLHRRPRFFRPPFPPPGVPLPPPFHPSPLPPMYDRRYPDDPYSPPPMGGRPYSPGDRDRDRDFDRDRMSPPTVRSPPTIVSGRGARGLPPLGSPPLRREDDRPDSNLARPRPQLGAPVTDVRG